MNSAAWVSYFEENRKNRPEFAWHTPYPEDAATAHALAASLSHFQLGESGGGAHLLRQARRQYPDDPDYVRALELFIEEEQEHARLLARLVERFGGKLLANHWTHSMFRCVRRALGTHFELQVLAIAEMVGTAYYRLLQRRVRDAVTEQACALILRDEAKHLEFHVARFAEVQRRWLPIERAGWATQLQVLFLTAANVAWLDHRPALQALGADRREFFVEGRLECIRFIEALQPAPVGRPWISAATLE